MSDTTIALVTGGNKGLGFTTAKRLAAQGWTVVLGVRDADRGAKAAAELGVEWVALDVTDDDSVRAAAAEVQARHGRIDVLVNNAGITGPYAEVAATTADDVAACFAVNVYGPVRVTNAFLPLLRRSAAPRIVMVSSGLGSHGRTSDPDRIESQIVGLPYTSSKAALNMLTAQYAKGLPDVRVNVVDPGYTATDLNHHSGPQTVEEGTDAIVALAGVAPDGPTGGFFDRVGPVPW